MAPAPALLRQRSPLYSLFGALHALESGRANRASSSPGPLLGWDVSGFIYLFFPPNGIMDSPAGNTVGQLEGGSWRGRRVQRGRSGWRWARTQWRATSNRLQEL